LQQQVKVDEAKRGMMDVALEEQADSLRSDFEHFLQQLREEYRQELLEATSETAEVRRVAEAEKVSYGSLLSRHHALETAEQELRQKLEMHEQTAEKDASLRKELHRWQQREVKAEAALECNAQKLAAAVAFICQAEVAEATATEKSAAQEKELVELRFEYARRLQAVRGEHAGHSAALRAMEDDAWRQCHELALAHENQAALVEAVEAAAAGEAAEARIAQAAAREEASSARNRRLALKTEVQQEADAEVVRQLLELRREVGHGERCKGRSESRALLAELRVDVQRQICCEIKSNPCSELRRSICRDLKQELRDQLKSEVLSEMQRSGDKVFGSWSPVKTDGSPERQRRFNGQTHSPPTAVPESSIRGTTASTGTSASTRAALGDSGSPEIDEDLSLRGAALMEAFSKAAREDEESRQRARPPIPRLNLPLPETSQSATARELPRHSLEEQASALLAQVMSERSSVRSLRERQFPLFP